MKKASWSSIASVAALLLAILFGCISPVQAVDSFPDEQLSGSIGIQGTISTAPPTRGATIAVPTTGAIFTTTPITVSGLCPSSVLVKLFANNVFVGSTFCVKGSYTLQIDLFSGQNDLVARVYDALDQAGPDSNLVTVTFRDAQFAEFGTHVSLSSPFAQRGAAPGNEIQWPITVTGGVGPYAISVDWGDGSPTDLISKDSAGNFIIKHTYKAAGIYKVIVKATDKNGGTAFLQLIGQATGAVQNNDKKGGGVIIQREVLWWPAILMVPLIMAAYWVGRRSELYTLRKQLEKSRGK